MLSIGYYIEDFEVEFHNFVFDGIRAIKQDSCI